MDTIYALATTQGKSGVAVIRVSGPEAHEVGRRLCGSLPAERQVALRVLRDPDHGFLDEALVVCFESGRSFTGEQVVEFQTHGSIAVIRAILQSLSRMPGARMADSGEFTRRALENGRLDLVQVEALSDLIEAETESQRRQALRLFQGALGDRVAEWRERLVEAASLIEVTIDFADEEVPVDVSADVKIRLDSVLKEMRSQLQGFASAERVRSGFEVAIVGAPNAGKSTLLNALAGRDAAITSEIAGTTRDVIEVRMDIAGLAVTLLDTAGLRDTSDEIEAMGVERARARASAADLRVILRMSDLDEVWTPDETDIVVFSKCDLTGAEGISAKTGKGMDDLVERIGAALRNRIGDAGLVTRERHRRALADGIDHVESAVSLLESGPETYELVAEEVRTATRRLAFLIGQVDVENLLDNIFANFCLGK